MKKIFLIAVLLTCVFAQCQEYTFIPDSLRLLPLQELFKKEPPADFEPVYYEDGTLVAFKDVLPLIIEQKLKSSMKNYRKGLKLSERILRPLLMIKKVIF